MPSPSPSRIITAHLRTNVVSYLALFIALSTGAYAAGLKPDAVRSKHIKDGAVKGIDIGDGAVTGSQVAQASLGGEQIAAESLGGADISESTLGTVPNASIASHGGFARQSGGDEFGQHCDPEGTAFDVCATVSLSTSVPGRALVIGRVRASTENAVDSEEGHGVCRLGSSAANPISGTSVQFGVEDDDDVGDSEHSTLFGVTPPIGPGSHVFGIDCNQNTPGAIEYHGARVVAEMISPG